MRYLLSILALTLAIFSTNVRAGQREEAIVSGCLISATGGFVGFGYCAGAGLAGMAVADCTRDLVACSKSPVVKKLFCGIGIGGGCKPEQPTQLVRVLPWQGKCLAIYGSGMYLSSDCQNLRGGGNTVNVWDGHYTEVRGMAFFNDCIITAFRGGGIYRSCDGLNLGGGGNTKRVYQSAALVNSMSVVSDPVTKQPVLRTVFNSSPIAYCDPEGTSPGGGGKAYHCRQ